jgi:hypothetical protein
MRRNASFRARAIAAVAVAIALGVAGAPRAGAQMYHEIQRKLMRDVPMLPLMMRPEALLHSPKLQGMPTLAPICGLDLTRLSFT